MDCSEAHQRFLEYLGADRTLPPDLQSHLQDCPDCRGSLRQMRKGREALLLYMEEAAPGRHYLTAERRTRLMRAHARDRKIFRLTYRQFVAAAAAVAIVVSSLVIAATVPRMVRSAKPESPVARGGALQNPVVVTAHGQDGPLNVIRPITASRSPRPPQPGPQGEYRPVRANSAGMTVPVNHAFYDPDESSHWW